MNVFLRKRLDGAFAPACEESERLGRSMAPGELLMADIKSRNTRSLQWHKRYFALCQIIYANCEGVEMNGQWVAFPSVESVHLALKGMAGLYDGAIVLDGGVRAFLIRSIAFAKMSADEWAAAWPMICEVVHTRILPHVDRATLENEIATLAT